MKEEQHHIPFNSALETGVRSLVILEAAYPESFDIERLVEMDYIAVHSGDAGGPASLHAPLPLRRGELLVRRSIIERGLLLMISRNLIERKTSEKGFEYVASELASPFRKSLNAKYSIKLVERAAWAVEKFKSVHTNEIQKMSAGFYQGWTSQFQAIEQNE